MPRRSRARDGPPFPDAMLRFELCEKLAHRPKFSFFRVFQALTNAFFRIDASGNVLQLLIISALGSMRHSGLLITRLSSATRILRGGELRQYLVNAW